VPNGVFQIRSRHDVGRCIGATVPDEEVEDVDYGIAQRNFVDGAPLLLQRCDLNTLPQFWYVDDEYKLVNVRDTSSVRKDLAQRTTLTGGLLRLRCSPFQTLKLLVIPQ